ncbi:MAG: hypothetical protein Q9201_002768 [Fulgogasparrea decipioides]
MAESLEDRLRSHAKAFDGLLSLIPAKLYYGEDTTDQWQRKKQTKEEARAAKRAKLDPDNSKSAKDVLDERAETAKKRKRGEEDDGSEVEGVVPEAPIQGSKKQKKEAKRQKREDKGGKVDHGGSKRADKNGEQDPRATAKTQSAKAKEVRRVEKRKAKAERKKAKEEKKKQPAEPSDGADNEVATDGANVDHDQLDAEASHSDDDDPRRTDIYQMDVSELANEPQHLSPSTASPTPNPDSPAFDQPAVLSGSSSVSSIAPPPTSDDTRNQSEKEASKLKVDHAELESRLRRRIEKLRASRNADGLNGKPARTRQELIEARRQKAEQSKAHKKELRRKEKEEAARKKAETLAHGSPLLSPASGSLGALSPQPDTNNFSFGRIAFADGQQASAQLNSIIDPKHKAKGPQDPLTALKAAQNKEFRINSLDEAKRTDIAEKDMWLNARKRAHGERVRDDTSLLKKTLKRKEKQKKKSEQEWGERLEGVKKAGEAKQRKREENLAKRREEKGAKGKKLKAEQKKKKRPGFEGSFRTKAPRK